MFLLISFVTFFEQSEKLKKFEEGLPEVLRKFENLVEGDFCLGAKVG